MGRSNKLPSLPASCTRRFWDCTTGERNRSPGSSRSSNTSMLIGYARISTHDQTLSLQKDALEKAGCEKIFTDTVSGTKAERKGLTEALSHLREGDTLVVWRLDRLGRSLRHLIDTVTELNARGVEFKSLQENIDTTTSGGKLVFHIFGALAEFEREIIKERTRAGLTSARSRGKVGGRPKALTAKEMQILRNMASDKSLTVSDICKTLGIGRTTFYRYVKAGERE
jgi:DNA invertase Pin-like site-specific DNA recombinase